MKQLIISSLLWMVTVQVAAQGVNVDSLVNVLETQKPNVTEQLELYHNIASTFGQYDFEKSAEYAKKGLKLAEKEKNNVMISKFYAILGRSYGIKADFDSTLIFFNKSLDFAIGANDKDLEAGAYNGIGITYARREINVSALEYFIKALAIYENSANKKMCIRLMTNIGTLYRTLADANSSFNYLEKAKNMVEETDDEQEKMIVYYAYGAICAEIKDIGQEKIEEALAYGLKSYEISYKLNDKRTRASAADLLRHIYSHQLPDYDLAWKYANEVMEIALEHGDPILIRDSYLSISDILLRNGRYKECIDAALKGWEMDSSLLRTGNELVKNIILANIGLGDKDQASLFVKKLILLYNRYVEQSSRESMSEMEVKYETEKKEMRITALERERRLFVWLSIAGVLLVIALGIALLQMIKSRRKELRLIASEAIQEGEIGERTRIAKDLHDRLGNSLTAVKIGLNNAENLQNISEKLDACMKEVREITNNVMPRSLHRFGMKGALEDYCTQYENLNFHFFGEDRRIKQNMEYTVYCCARELVNNALKHSGASTINIQLVQSRKHVSLTVQDDGCGFDERTVNKGDGLQNIRNRVASCRGKIDTVSAHGKGTETVIELKTEGNIEQIGSDEEITDK